MITDTVEIKFLPLKEHKHDFPKVNVYSAGRTKTNNFNQRKARTFPYDNSSVTFLKDLMVLKNKHIKVDFRRVKHKNVLFYKCSDKFTFTQSTF